MARKDELLNLLADHVLADGIGELSLRPLAAAAGTNARMLLYHFESKEGMVEALLAECNRRRADVLAGCSGGTPLTVWNCVSSRRAEPHMRLSIEIESLASQGRKEFSKEARRISAEWIALFSRRYRNKAAAAVAASACRGLLLDLYSSGDRSRANSAAHELSAMLDRAKV